MSRAVRALVVAVVLAGCAPKFPVEQRTTQGPVADDFWRMSVFLQNGRPATFEEQNFWLEKIDLQIRDYLRRNQDKASGPTIQTFRFLRQVEVGMDKEQVLILLGPPVTVTGDPGEMEKAARRYWPMIKGNATEAWLYQLGWTFYFAGQRLVDITQYQRPF